MRVQREWKEREKRGCRGCGMRRKKRKIEQKQQGIKMTQMTLQENEAVFAFQIGCDCCSLYILGSWVLLEFVPVLPTTIQSYKSNTRNHKKVSQWSHIQCLLYTIKSIFSKDNQFLLSSSANLTTYFGAHTRAKN